MKRRLFATARGRSLAAVTVGALGWAAVMACNQTTIQTPIRSFDRPSDVALVCMQYDLNAISASSPHGVFDVRPLSDCEPVKAQSLAITPNPQAYANLPAGFVPPVGPGDYHPFLMALVTQSARGEVALVDTAQEKLVDADPYTPGFGFVPVGKLPEHVRATSDGCFAVTANTDSCNLSRLKVLDVMHNAEASVFAANGATATATASGVDALPLTVPAPGGGVKTLYARPSWIEMAPDGDAGSLPSLTGASGGAPGQCTPQTVINADGTTSTTQHKVWVALPACGALVKVKIEADPQSEPTVVQALRVTSSGVQEVTDLSTLDCPVECAGVPSDMGPPAAPPPSDMASPDGVNLPQGHPWPSTFAIDIEGDVSGTPGAGRLFIGDGYGERIDIVPFDVKTAKFGAARSVTLDPGTAGLPTPGVRVVRAGPRSEAGKFLYAVARDGTVRVIDLDREVECETNPDPRYVAAGFDLQQTPETGLPEQTQPLARKLGCFPLGQPDTPRRSPLATTPGISLTPGQIPVDVAFVHIDVPAPDPTMASAPPPAAPGLMVGDFAWIFTSDGSGLVVNIYDACPQPNQPPESQTAGPYNPACSLANIPQAITDTEQHPGHPQALLLDRVSHRLRAGHGRFMKPLSESDATGMARVTDHLNPCAVAVPPTSTGIPDGGVDGGAGGTSNGCNASALLPGLFAEPVPTAFTGGVPENRVVRFVDPDRARNETWVMTWEGTVPGSDRALGQPFIVDNATNASDNGGYLSDPGGAWCNRGILAGDKMILRGCTTDSECDQAGGFTCVHDPGAFSDVTQGMCLPTDKSLDKNAMDADQWPTVCGPLLRSQRKYRILSARQSVPVPGPSSGALTDLIKIAEIYEPEYPEQRISATGSDSCRPNTDDCANVTVQAQAGGGTLQTSCLADVDGVYRCLLSCADPKTMMPNDKLCGVDFECAPSQVDGKPRCMRAPIDKALWAQCMPEAQQYEVHIGDAFEVAGSSSGYVSSEMQDPATHECIVPPQTNEYVRLRQWRIPLTPANACPMPNPMTYSPLDSMPAGSTTNVCSVSQSTQRVVHFENAIFNIAMELPLGGNGQPLIPPDGTSVSMAITGGGGPLVALIGTDVQAQQPRSAVVAPDRQTVYVVDEGKAALATGLRGQLLRLFSPSQSVDTTFVVR